MSSPGETFSKIKTYKISKAGGRGLKLMLPAVWTRDLGLGPSDELDVYRDTEDRLLIVARKREEVRT